MLLTIVLTLDTEKPDEYDQLFFKAMEWSAGGALGEVEVVVLSQREGHQPAAHVSRCPRNSDGYPVWDLFADVRDVWDQIHGEYVTFQHSEFCWGPDRLRRTLCELDRTRPVIALCNLRRTRPIESASAIRTADDPLSRLLSHWITEGECGKVTEWWDCFNGFPWMSEQKPGLTSWLEDVFIARRDWLEAIRFFECGAPQPFQDVSNIMGVALELLAKHELAPPVWRFDREVCEIVHLAHEKSWASYSPAMRDWFLERCGDWANTTLVRDDLWRRVLNTAHPGGVVQDFRRGPGGTVTRWHSEFSGWLQNGGEKRVLEWLNP